jgi:hypothetical protein
MAAVADLAGHHDGSERHPQPVRPGHGPDRLLHQDQTVGGTHRIGGGHRQLELAGGVLGMELLDGHTLVVEHDEQFPDVVGEFDHPRHAVGGARAGRGRAVTLVAADEPLDLEGHLQLQALLGGPVGHGGGEEALACHVGLPVLRVPVGRRPGPAGLAREPAEGVEVGVEAQVPDRAADVG